MIAQHGERAVDLLGKDGAGEFVGEGEGRQRQKLVGSGALVGGEAVVGADEEDEVLPVLFLMGEDLGKLSGIELFASRVQEDFAGGGVFGEQVKAGGVDFAHRTGGEAGSAFDEFGGKGVQQGVARLADEIEKDFHLYPP